MTFAYEIAVGAFGDIRYPAAFVVVNILFVSASTQMVTWRKRCVIVGKELLPCVREVVPLLVCLAFPASKWYRL